MAGVPVSDASLEASAAGILAAVKVLASSPPPDNSAIVKALTEINATLQQILSALGGGNDQKLIDAATTELQNLTTSLNATVERDKAP